MAGAEGRQFTIIRTFDAPRAEVWRAWTDPSIAARWWHPGGMETRPDSVTVDLRPGGTYRYTMVGPDGDEHPTGGTYLEVRDLERLQFTWGDPDGTGEVAVITVDLADTADGGTTMTFHVEGVEGRPGDDGVHDGWVEAFDFLDRQVDRPGPLEPSQSDRTT